MCLDGRVRRSASPSISDSAAVTSHHQLTHRIQRLIEADPARHVARGHASYFGNLGQERGTKPENRERGEVLGERAARPPPTI